MTRNFKSGTRVFKGGIGNFRSSTRNFKDEKLFRRQDEGNFGKGGSNAFNSMNMSRNNNQDKVNIFNPKNMTCHHEDG